MCFFKFKGYKILIFFQLSKDSLNGRNKVKNLTAIIIVAEVK